MLRIEINFPFPDRIMGNVLRNYIHFQLGPCKKGISVPIWEGVTSGVSPFQLVVGVSVVLDVLKQFDVCGFLLNRDTTQRRSSISKIGRCHL